MFSVEGTPKPGDVLLTVPINKQALFMQKAAENLPPLKAQIGKFFGAEPQPMAKPEVRGKEMYIYNFVKYGGFTKTKPIYSNKASMRFYFDGESLKYEDLLGKMRTMFDKGKNLIFESMIETAKNI